MTRPASLEVASPSILDDLPAPFQDAGSVDITKRLQLESQQCDDTADEVDPLLTEMFGGLPRCDQRRAAAAYVRGLLCDNTKKSIRAMAESTQTQSQTLQQFVGQSTWQVGPVRQGIAKLLAKTHDPNSWVIADTNFSKTGSHSAGVARQYVPELGRSLNCQRALTIVTTGAIRNAASWRMVIPSVWNHDEARRKRARLPTDQLSRDRLSYVLELVDELSLEWNLLPKPIVVDMQHEPGATALADALDCRGLSYLIGITGSHLAAVRVASRPAVRSGVIREIPVASIALATSAAPRFTHTVSGPQNKTRRTQFYSHPLAKLDHRDTSLTAGDRMLLIDWPYSKPDPARWWLTNLDEDLSALAKRLSDQLHAQHAVTVLAQRCGLHDYEGRSYTGWNHHVTMSAAALAYLQLR